MSEFLARYSRGLLATYGDCHRRNTNPEDSARDLLILVADNWAPVIQDYLRHPAPNWAKKLCDADLSKAREVFIEFDEEDLALWSAGQLADDASKAEIERRRQALRQAEEHIFDNPLRFQSALEVAAATLTDCRSDLDETDYALWETLIKHRAVEEAVEESERIVALFTDAEKAEIVALARRLSNS